MCGGSWLERLYLVLAHLRAVTSGEHLAAGALVSDLRKEVGGAPFEFSVYIANSDCNRYSTWHATCP